MPTSDGSTRGPNPRMLVGVFVGGESSRMGVSKGLLGAPDTAETLVERALRVAVEALPDARRVLVGQRAEYSHLGWPALADAQNDSGPLGGLVALLQSAQAAGEGAVLAVACDMPFFSGRLLRRLASEQPTAALLAPVADDRFQPLFARYSVTLLEPFAAALAQGRFALQPLLRHTPASVLATTAADVAELRDWDRPEDVGRS